MLDWIRKSAKTADITMSVCTGAYVLAKTGLLAGKAATTHHSAYKEFATEFPDIQLQRGARICGSWEPRFRRRTFLGHRSRFVRCGALLWLRVR